MMTGHVLMSILSKEMQVYVNREDRHMVLFVLMIDAEH